MTDDKINALIASAFNLAAAENINPTPPASTEAQLPTAEPIGNFTLPAIGQPWPGIDGVYAGVSRGEDGEPDAHLVLLNAQSEDVMSWDAAVEWAKGLGDGARLPTRFESALLYANVRDKLDTSRWHWTGTQYSSSYAFVQDFAYGSSGWGAKVYAYRVRAVRRLNAQSFNPSKGVQAQDTDGVAPSQASDAKDAAWVKRIRELVEQLCSAAVAYGEHDTKDAENAYYAAKAHLIDACGVGGTPK